MRSTDLLSGQRVSAYLPKDENWNWREMMTNVDMIEREAREALPPTPGTHSRSGSWRSAI